MTDFIHEAPPPENPKPAAPEKPTSEKERQKRVYAYIAVLFTVAFILILWSFLANHRSNQQVIDQLKGSTSMMQSTLEQNAKLEDEVKARPPTGRRPLSPHSTGSASWSATTTPVS